MTATGLALRVGFLGKLPARGDFVLRGLPRGFADAWDAWLQESMTGSRDILGDAWLPAWLEAPVWRFALPAGHCGPDAVAGVMLPSVDRAGRHWPLTLAATFPGFATALLPDDAWLDTLEAAGMAAVMEDAAPERIEELLAATAPACAPAGMLGQWWTAGAPRVAATRFALGALPGPAAFAAMLDDGPAVCDDIALPGDPP
jgi:type VI secretion system protein ImpM